MHGAILPLALYALMTWCWV